MLVNVHRDGTDPNVLEIGESGRPVVILHGLAGSVREFLPSAEVLRDRYRVLPVDQRGHGRSTRRPVDTDPPRPAPNRSAHPERGTGTAVGTDRAGELTEDSPRALCRRPCLHSAGALLHRQILDPGHHAPADPERIHDRPETIPGGEARDRCAQPRAGGHGLRHRPVDVGHVETE